MNDHEKLLVSIARQLSGINFVDLTKAEQNIINKLVDAGFMVYEPQKASYELSPQPN